MYQVQAHVQVLIVSTKFNLQFYILFILSLFIFLTRRKMSKAYINLGQPLSDYSDLLSQMQLLVKIFYLKI